MLDSLLTVPFLHSKKMVISDIVKRPDYLLGRYYISSSVGQQQAGVCGHAHGH